MNFNPNWHVKREQIKVSFNARRGELLNQRKKLKNDVTRGIPAAQTKLNDCERELAEIPAKREEAEASLIAEIENTQLGSVTRYVRAFVAPRPHRLMRCRSERCEMPRPSRLRTVIEYEQERGAEVKDVSNPQLKKGFDLESRASKR